jgi:hypothetical protein
MNLPRNIEIPWTCALTEQLPQLKSCVGGGLWLDGAAFIVPLMLYGEAALSVVRTRFPAATHHAGDWRVP